MHDPGLTTTFVNDSNELLPHTLNEQEGKSVDDLFAMYFPNGPIRKSIAYFGGSGISQIPVVNNAFYAIEHVHKQMLGTPSLKTGLDESIVAGGKGFGMPSSVLSAMGESVERFSGTMKPFDEHMDIRYGSYGELTSDGLHCLSPEELPLFAEEQYANPDFVYSRFDENAQIGWVQGRRLVSGDQIWIPAQVALFFYLSSHQEDLIAYSSSAGLACHVTEALALYGSITELLERDGMMASWYSGIPARQIQVDRPLATAEMNRHAAKLQALPGDIACYAHPLDMPEIPVVSAIELVPHLKKYSFYAGGAAAFDIDEAMIQALVEYGQSEAQLKLATVAPDRAWALGADLYMDVEPDKPLEEMSTFLEHLGYYGYPENAERMDWFLNDGEDVKLTDLPARRFDSPEDRLQGLLNALDSHGIDPICIEYTPPQMKQLSVTKVVIPELVQPHVSANPYLGHPRLYELPRKLGLTDELLSFDELVDGPVPFP